MEIKKKVFKRFDYKIFDIKKGYAEHLIEITLDEVEKVIDEGCGESLMFDGDVELQCGNANNFVEGKKKVPVDQLGNVILCKRCKKLKLRLTGDKRK